VLISPLLGLLCVTHNTSQRWKFLVQWAMLSSFPFYRSPSGRLEKYIRAELISCQAGIQTLVVRYKHHTFIAKLIASQRCSDIL
jgi:hypothetical protein